jgi:hypothetical protein
MKRPTENKASQFHDPEPVKEPAHAEEQLAQHNNKCKQHRPQPDPEDPRRKKIENLMQKQEGEFFCFKKGIVTGSVPDPDPTVLGPLGSGSVRQRFESGSESIHRQAKRVRKAFISTVL